jgi:hypothetical protein
MARLSRTTDEAKAVVRLGAGLGQGFRGEGGQLLRVPGPPPPLVDCQPPGGGEQPGSGLRRDAVVPPPLEGYQQRLLDQLLGALEVAQDANQGGGQPAGLLPEDRGHSGVGAFRCFYRW